MWFLLGMLLLIRVMLIVIKRDWGRLLSNIILLWFLFLFKYYCFIDLFVDDWVVDLGVVVVCFVVLLKILKSKWNMFIWFFEIYKYLKKKNFVDICINLEWEMFYIFIFIYDVCIFCMFIVMLFLRFVWIF